MRKRKNDYRWDGDTLYDADGPVVTIGDQNIIDQSDSKTCDEEVTHGGELDVCGATAVALRIDVNYGSVYTVCAFHARAPMVPWSRIAARLDTGRTFPANRPRGGPRG